MSLLDLGQPLAALFLVLGLVVLAAWLARRFLPHWHQGGGDAHRRLAIVEQRVLDPRTRLVLVRCDEGEHLLVLGSNGVTALVGKGERPRPGGGDGL